MKLYGDLSKEDKLEDNIIAQSLGLVFNNRQKDDWKNSQSF